MSYVYRHIHMRVPQPFHVCIVQTFLKIIVKIIILILKVKKVC
jgi:hypothetical protein